MLSKAPRGGPGRSRDGGALLPGSLARPQIPEPTINCVRQLSQKMPKLPLEGLSIYTTVSGDSTAPKGAELFLSI